MKAKSFRFITLVMSFLIMLVFSSAIFGQIIKSTPRPTPKPTPKMMATMEKKPMAAAVGDNLYCAGYIDSASINTDFEIVGSNDEPEQTTFAQGDYLYISGGSNQGVKVGDEFSVMRPKGKFSTRFSTKKGLGIYVSEVGAVEIVKVKNDVSVAMVKTSCDVMYLGDLLERTEKRNSPMTRKAPDLDLFADPNGKSTGRIVLAREGRELLSRDQIVYVDLGSEDNVKSGDYLTVYRPLGKGGVVGRENETISARDAGYQSKVYRGGKFSNQAPRKSGKNAEGGIVTINEAKERRPNGLRKVVGEVVVLSVRAKTATAVITRTAAEIHTGDMVEIQ